MFKDIYELINNAITLSGQEDVSVIFFVSFILLFGFGIFLKHAQNNTDWQRFLEENNIIKTALQIVVLIIAAIVFGGLFQLFFGSVQKIAE